MAGRKRRRRTIKRIWDGVTSVIVGLVVLLAIALVGVRLIGFKVFTVLSGSMEPAYHTGSLIYVREADYRKLKAGDVITFMLDEDTVATHRIVEVVPDEQDPSVLRYRTKGDANDSADGGLVHYKNIIGRPVFTIPGLGYMANYIQNPPGTYVVMAGGAVLIMLVFLPDLFSGDDRKKSSGRRRPGDSSGSGHRPPRDGDSSRGEPDRRRRPRPEGSRTGYEGDYPPGRYSGADTHGGYTGR